MTQETIIQAVDSITFEVQKYIQKDEQIIPSFFLDTQFLSETDYIEYYLFDQNKNLINTFVVSNKSDYKVINGDIIINPENDLNNQGIFQGSYYINYNFFRKRLSSDNENNYYISEINSDRTEIRLSSNKISYDDIVSSFNDFNEHRENSEYFVDFYLNFGENNLFIANNIKLDTTSEYPSLLIKLYNPLPIQYGLKDSLWVVEPISNSQTYLVEIPEPIIEIIDYEYIQGPNFSIKPQTGTSTQLYSFNDLYNSSVTSSQQQLSNILNQKGININVDYENFSNFIHFSSAKTRLENFYYKVSLIESYREQLSDFLGSINDFNTYTVSYSSSKAIIESNINSIIGSFDGYENFLYYDSGSQYS